ncbi:MAG: NYN domain-containing protein [Candidatus Hadarchaeota archaeon]
MIRRTSLENQRAALFVDVQNMYYSAKNLYKGKVDYSALFKVAKDGRRLIRAIAYVVESHAPEEEEFFEVLEEIGFQVRRKELREFYDGKKKGDWDMGMAIDSIRLSEKIDVAVIVTGDGDFKSLVQFLKAEGIQVEVISFGKSTSEELVKEADVFLNMDKKKDMYLM